MTPEQLTQLNNLQKQVDDLRAAQDVAFIENIKRFVFGTSAKTASSATTEVDEGGSDTLNVMAAPDGFIRVNGKNIPYIN